MSGRGKHVGLQQHRRRGAHGCPADGDNGLENEGGEADGRASRKRKGAADAPVSVGGRPFWLVVVAVSCYSALSVYLSFQSLSSRCFSCLRTMKERLQTGKRMNERQGVKMSTECKSKEKKSL